MNLGALTEVRAEPAGASQPVQFASARPRNDEPVAAHDVALDGAGVLQQERALPAGHLAGDPLDAAEALLDVDPGQTRSLRGTVVRHGLVLADGDDGVRANCPVAGIAHVAYLPVRTCRGPIRGLLWHGTQCSEPNRPGRRRAQDCLRC